MISVSIIGSGNLAYHLIDSFGKNDAINLTQVFTRKKSNIARNGNFEIVDDFSDLKPTDVTIVAVSDQAINEVSSQILFENSLVVHTSGGTDMLDIDSKNRQGVFYPLQTFSKNKKVDFQETPICIEAQIESDLEILDKLAKIISNKVYKINSNQRKALHIAAVFVSNFSNHMYKIGFDICQENQLPFDILQPLISETANKIVEMSPSAAQTGPAKRLDFETIAKHLKYLKHSDKKHLYETITQSIIQNG